MSKITFDIDVALLGVTERIARTVYHFCGINNFMCSKICIFLFSISSIMDTSLRFEKEKDFASFAWLFILIPATWLVGFILWRQESLCSHNFRNPARIIFRSLRLIAVFIALYVSYISFSEFLKTDMSLYEIVKFSNKALRESTYLFFQYFASIEPEDPTDSWLKKQWNSFKKLFEPSGLPSPA